MNFPTSAKQVDGWRVLAERSGLRAVERGQGRPVVIFSGLEGSGESCLHLALPVVEAGGGAPQRPILIDYSGEAHATFDELVASASALVREVTAGAPCVFWCQSFGNLLGTEVALSGGVDVQRFVQVSPFTALPGWKVGLGPVALKVTPAPLYRALSPFVGSWQFGPDGGNKKHPFFGSLNDLRPSALARRAGWLRGRDFRDRFAALRAPRCAFLGTRDRLVDLGAQKRIFGDLANGADSRLQMVEGSGHVVLPPPVIEQARQQLRAWFWSS